LIQTDGCGSISVAEFAPAVHLEGFLEPQDFTVELLCRVHVGDLIPRNIDLHLRFSFCEFPSVVLVGTEIEIRQFIENTPFVPRQGFNVCSSQSGWFSNLLRRSILTVREFNSEIVEIAPVLMQT